MTNVPGCPFPGVSFAQVEPSQGKFLIEFIEGRGIGSSAIDPSTGALSQSPTAVAAFPRLSSGVIPNQMVVVAPSN